MSVNLLAILGTDIPFTRQLGGSYTTSILNDKERKVTETYVYRW